MAGVMSLMQPQGQQGPMPGQAPQQAMPGMMPQQGAATPAAMVGPLTQMHTQQLVQLMLNPRPDGPPLYAVISAIAEKQKAAKAAQAAQGQQVMAQNQQMQQQPPVAAQVVQAAAQMQDPLMAAYGGETQGYAGGGAVAFQSGTSSRGLPFPASPSRIDVGGDVPIYTPGPDREPGETEAEYLARKQREAAEADEVSNRPLRRLYRYLAEKVRAPSPVAQMRTPAAQAAAPAAAAAQPTLADILSDLEPPKGPMMPIPEIQIAPSPAPTAGPRRQPMAGPAPAAQPAQPALAPQAGLSPEMEAYFRNRMSDLSTRQGLPEDILAGRAGLEALARESIAAQRGEAETFGREARERRDAALARAQRGILNDPQALLALAGSIDTRKGQGIGSLARGAAGLMSQREAAAEAAREKYATAQQTERALQANVRQATMLEAQRAQALREGDFNRANQIKDQIDALMMQRETLLMERRDKAIEQARQERLARATETQAQASMVQAGKPPGEIALMQWLQDPKNRKMYDDIQSSKREDDRMVKLYEIYSKNKLQLGNPTFEEFVAGFKAASGAAPGAAPGRQLKYNPATGKIE